MHRREIQSVFVQQAVKQPDIRLTACVFEPQAMKESNVWLIAYVYALQAMKEKVEGEYNTSHVSAVMQGLDGTPVVLIQVCSRTTMPDLAPDTLVWLTVKASQSS